MAVTTTSTITSLNSFLDKAGLAVAKANEQYGAFGMKKIVPEKNSLSMKFRRWERFAPTTGAQLATIRTITEATTPGDTTPTKTDVTITLAQYGLLTRFSDLAMATSDLAYPEVELQKRNAQNMSETSDCVYRDNIMAGTTIQRLTNEVGGISGAARTDVLGRINAASLQKAIRTLDGNDAERFAAQINASSKVSTTGVREAYIAIVHPNTVYDLETLLQGFIPVTNYASDASTYKGEVGAWKNIRFVSSTLAKYFADAGGAISGTPFASTTGTSADVYATLVIGKNAYACVDLAGNSEVTWLPPNSKDNANPLGLWANLGWKATLGSGILNEGWILRIEHCVSA